MNRVLVIGIVALVLALGLLGWTILRRPTRAEILYGPSGVPTSPPTTLREPPQPEPSPWIEDNDLPPQPEVKVAVCHCVPAYGACVDQLMVREAARLHAIRDDHDLIGRECATRTEEERALMRVLKSPERIEANSTMTLGMADRAAYRARVN